ncbi:hypothetical protein C6341_g6601 [Phytophthora cactorum]|nr:hypothetical protein C6341_g6601 [Phytophthora cactorum]
MVRWVSLFAEYDFRVEYKPGRLNVVAHALSRRPDYAVKTTDANRIGVERVTGPSSSLVSDVKAAYASDADAKHAVDDDYDLRMRIMYEYHDFPTTGHPGREKKYLLLPRDFYWNHQYKWVRKYVRAWEVCQPSQASLQSLLTP